VIYWSNFPVTDGAAQLVAGNREREFYESITWIKEN
jgi:hypothetical protein